MEKLIPTTRFLCFRYPCSGWSPVISLGITSGSRCRWRFWVSEFRLRPHRPPDRLSVNRSVSISPIASEIHRAAFGSLVARKIFERSEEHTSELQSRLHLVCRLLLEKKKKRNEKQ